MAKYKIDCDSLDEAKKLDKKLSSKGATNVVRGLGMMGSRTGYYVEFDFDGDVSSLGFGPFGFTKIKDYGFGPYDDDHYQVISFIGELSKSGTARKSDILRLLNYHGGGWTPNELQKTIAQNPKYFTQTGITVTLTQEGKRVLKEMSKVFGSSVHDGKIVGSEDRIKSASWYRDSTTISDMAKYDVIIWEKGVQNNRYYAADIDNKETAMKLFNKAKQLHPNSIVQLIKGDRLISDARKIRANSISVGRLIEGDGGEWWKVTSVKRGSSGDVDVEVKSETTGATDSWYFLHEDFVNIRDSAEVTDGKIVGGEGRSMDGLPYGLYQEGGRSYRGFEITSSENGLRKGVYRFYNWGGGVPFGNSAVDGQFSEAQFQKLIGEGKVKLLDSVSVVGDATISNLSAGELRKGMRITSVGTYHGNNVISKVVKEKGDVVKVLFENGESESFHSFATIRVVKDSHLVNDAGVHAEQMAQVQYDKLIAKQAELTSEIDRNDNNPNYNIFRVHKELDSIRSDIEKLKKDWGYALKDSNINDVMRERMSDSVAVGSTVKVPLKNGGSEDAKVVKVEGDIITVKLKGGMELDVARSILKDSAKKMFKVVDKATGKTLLVKATDSLAAVKRVSSLKDVDTSSYSKQLDKIRALMKKNRKIEWGGHTDMGLQSEIRKELLKVPDDVEKKNDLMREFGWGY